MNAKLADDKKISRKEKELKLTQREIEVILFLRKNKQPINVNTLQKEV